MFHNFSLHCHNLRDETTNPYRQIVYHAFRIPAYDGGKRFGHMTTNLAECINSVLQGARSLPICAIVKTTFERTKDWFVERGTKAECMLRAGHLYPEDITAQLHKNE